MQTNIIFLVLVYFSISIYLVEGDDLKNEEKEYLRKFGYLHMKKDSPFVASMTSTDVLTSALKDFQRMAGLDQTGVMDEKTREMMTMPRCGVSDLQVTNPRRRKRYVLYGTKWNEKALTYRFVNYPKVPPKDKVEKTIAKAFEYWQNASGLTFKKTIGQSVIEVSFRVKAHGDDDAFDGPGGTLAHAFFPTQNPIGGDVHFDDDETWTFDEHRGTNLLQVAVHELGHSLGLSHSDVKGSIMAPFYRDYDPNLKLHDDDIRGIQNLYGQPVQKNIAAPTPVTKPPIIEGICQVKQPDAVFSFFDLLFIFQGKKLFVTKGFFDNEAKQLSSSSIFPQLPESIDAAFAYDYVSSRNIKYDFIYFFKGFKVWKYLFQEKPFGFILMKEYPKLITTEFPGIPSNLNAAFEWNLNGKMYFFKDNQYYRFSEAISNVSPTYPRPITKWNLEIDKVDTVFNYPSKSFSDLYFVKDGQVYKYDSTSDRVAYGYPKPLQWLLGCASNDPVKNLVLENLSGSSTAVVVKFTTLIFAFISCYFSYLWF